MGDVKFLNKIISWAENDDSIRMLIQTGSHARNDNAADDLSDFDIEVFVDDLGKYSCSDGWMKKIDEVWMHVPLTNSVGDPTRLIIFKGGIKVDFTLNAINDFDKLVKDQDSSDLFARGYKVLLDKDELSKKLKPPPNKNLPSEKPSREKFTALVEEFFFEAYHVAKYLKREDLWMAKFRDWTTKELSLTMFECYEKSIHGWDYDTWYLGIKIKKWVEKNIYEEIKNIFASFDKEDSEKALEASINLFRKVAKETAKNLNYPYPEEIDKNITSYINHLE